MRVPGILVGIALVGLVAWRTRVAAPGPEAPDTAAVSEAPAPPVATWDMSKQVDVPSGAALPDARQIKEQLSRAKAQHSLARAFERADDDGDFALAPSRILKSLVDRRCGFDGPESASVCRGLLFAVLKERLALPEDVTEARLLGDAGAGRCGVRAARRRRTQPPHGMRRSVPPTRASGRLAAASSARSSIAASSHCRTKCSPCPSRWMTCSVIHASPPSRSSPPTTARSSASSASTASGSPR